MSFENLFLKRSNLKEAGLQMYSWHIYFCISAHTRIQLITFLIAQPCFRLQLVAKVLARSIFFLPGCIGDRLPLPTPKTMLSFIHLTLWLYCNIVWGERGVCKIKYKVLKSKTSVMERYSIQRAKYFCH